MTHSTFIRTLGPITFLVLSLATGGAILAQQEQPAPGGTPKPSSARPATPAAGSQNPSPAGGQNSPAAAGQKPPAATAQSSPAGAGQNPPAAASQNWRPGLQPIHIERNSLVYLIRSTMTALHQANETGNYTVLRDLGAPGFQAANTAARLSEIFAHLRAQRLDLSGASIVEPQLIVAPQADTSGFMLLDGYLPLATQVNFKLVFAPVEGRWRIFGISVNLGTSAMAPAPGAMPAPQAGTAPTGASAPHGTPPS